MFSKNKELDKIKMTPSEINALTLALVKKSDVAALSSSLFSVDEVLSGAKQCEYSLIVTERKIYIVFDVTKDAVSKDNNPTLPYIGDVMKRVAQLDEGHAIRLAREHSGKEVVLLFPLAQCRGLMMLPFKKAHYVLLEVDASNQLNIHDPQGTAGYTFYPDRFKDDEFIREIGLKYIPEDNYHSYEQQNDDVVCGYYLHEYLRAITTTNLCNFVSIQLGDKDEIKVVDGEQKRQTYTSKRDYLDKNGALAILREQNSDASTSPSITRGASSDDF